MDDLPLPIPRSPVIVSPEMFTYLPSAVDWVSAPTSAAVGHLVTYADGAAFKRASQLECKSDMVANDTEVSQLGFCTLSTASHDEWRSLMVARDTEVRYWLWVCPDVAAPMAAGVMLMVLAAEFGVYLSIAVPLPCIVRGNMFWCAVRNDSPLVTVSLVPLLAMSVTALPLPCVVSDTAAPCFRFCTSL